MVTQTAIPTVNPTTIQAVMAYPTAAQVVTPTIIQAVMANLAAMR